MKAGMSGLVHARLIIQMPMLVMTGSFNTMELTRDARATGALKMTLRTTGRIMWSTNAIGPCRPMTAAGLSPRKILTILGGMLIVEDCPRMRGPCMQTVALYRIHSRQSGRKGLNPHHQVGMDIGELSANRRPERCMYVRAHSTQRIAGTMTVTAMRMRRVEGMTVMMIQATM